MKKLQHFLLIASICLAITAQGQNAKELEKEAQSYLQNGEFELALSAINKALEAEDLNLNLYMIRATIYLAKNEMTRSLSDYEFILRHESENPAANYNAGFIYYSLGQQSKDEYQIKRSCEYFAKAASYGSKKAESMLSKCK